MSICETSEEGERGGARGPQLPPKHVHVHVLTVMYCLVIQAACASFKGQYLYMYMYIYMLACVHLYCTVYTTLGSGRSHISCCQIAPLSCTVSVSGVL